VTARTSGRAPNRASSVYQGADGRWHGRVWMGVADDGSPDRRHVSAATEREVLTKVRRLERSRQSGRIAVSGRAPTVEAWLAHWLDNIAAHSVRERTLTGYRSYVRLYAVPGLGKHRLDRLQPEHVESLYRRMLHDGLSPSTVHTLHRILRTALNEAVRRDRIPVNPVTRARAPRLVEREIDPLTQHEAARIVTAATESRNGARWLVGLALGLRQGEALGLRWHDIDLDTGTITVRRALQRATAEHGCGGQCGRRRATDCPQRLGGGLTLVEPKSRAGRRRVALPPQLVHALLRHRDDQAVERLTAANLWTEHDLVFTTETGAPIDPRSDWADWKRLLQRADVRDARLHDARHTAATLLLVQGVAPRTVMDIMGWTEARMLSRYQHVVDELRHDAARRMGAALWGDADPTPGGPGRPSSRRGGGEN